MDCDNSESMTANPIRLVSKALHFGKIVAPPSKTREILKQKRDLIVKNVVPTREKKSTMGTIAGLNFSMPAS
jgi:hypothetical protein